VEVDQEGEGDRRTTEFFGKGGGTTPTTYHEEQSGSQLFMGINILPDLPERGKEKQGKGYIPHTKVPTYPQEFIGIQGWGASN